jgi:hypothetical protein
VGGSVKYASAELISGTDKLRCWRGCRRRTWGLYSPNEDARHGSKHGAPELLQFRAVCIMLELVDHVV